MGQVGWLLLTGAFPFTAGCLVGRIISFILSMRIIEKRIEDAILKKGR